MEALVNLSFSKCSEISPLLNETRITMQEVEYEWKIHEFEGSLTV